MLALSALAMRLSLNEESLYSPREKSYTHWLSRAAWEGARIIQEQWTPQAAKLYDLLISIFSDQGRLCNLEKLKQESGVSESEWEDLMQYTCQVTLN
jgi:dipeptidyl-peptidase-3